MVRALYDRQRPDGSWDIYPGAPAGDINSTVEVYAALRATGVAPEHAPLTRARAWIHAHGGLADVRVFTRYWLALIGVWPWRDIPNLPPEIIRFPRWFPFSIYNFAQWARATMVPLAVLCARRPVFPLAGAGKLEELFPEGHARVRFLDLRSKKPGRWSLEALFVAIDRALHAAQSWRLIPFRENTIKLCLEWMIRHQDADGAWGGIQPPWIYGLLALHGEGYGLEHPVVARGLAALGEHWSYERDGGTHIQASEFAGLGHPVLPAGDGRGGPRAGERRRRWAGRWSIFSIIRSWSPATGARRSRTLRRAAGRSSAPISSTPTSTTRPRRCWCWPSCARRAAICAPRVDFAIERALGWLFGMQSANGGWAAFDRDNDKAIISKIPFCNFGEALDPPSVDVTAHVLEAFGALGCDKAVRKSCKRSPSSMREQEPEGSWFGRWGVNHIYGVGAVLPALGGDRRGHGRAALQKAVAWLIDKQNADGGWGESCASYMDADWIGRGDSTPSADRLGADGADGGGRRRGRALERGFRLSARPRSAPTEPGTNRVTPRPAFPAMASARASICAIRTCGRSSAKAPNCRAAS